MPHKLRYRQVHLDFHTSPDIPGIGTRFDKKQWQDALKAGHVDSITCFSKCHHGLSYHPTNVGTIHPHLGFDLLRAQMDACAEIDVKVPVYISAGLDDVMGSKHPEWREMSVEGRFQGWTSAFNKPGFLVMCFGTPYLDFLCEQIEEAVTLFPEASGIFLDIIHQGPCCCRWCLEGMKKAGLDAGTPEDRTEYSKRVMDRYYEMATAACRLNNPEMPVFHNSGHISKGNRDILKYFSHLELESLPTGGWGYDHFPLSAKYSQNLGLDYLGMTGKFHTTWGEFGGYKHPNALRYECAAMIAHGAKCSVGDQLHPDGRMDESTYQIMGAAYAEVERKEPWCDGAEGVADVAVLSSESETGNRVPDAGAGRALLEGHFLFDLIDRHCDLARYRAVILPDEIRLDDQLKALLEEYLAGGGRVLATGQSGLQADGGGFALDFGASWQGASEFQPDYVISDVLAPDFCRSPLVMYMPSQQVKAAGGQEIAGVVAPYFNRTWKHYCSHQHAPAADGTGFAAAVKTDQTLYLAHPLYSIYYGQGAVAYRQYVNKALDLLLGKRTLETNLASTGRVTLTRQSGHSRYALHVLYAPTAARGAHMRFSEDGYVRDSHQLEVVEDLPELHGVWVRLELPETISGAQLAPQNTSARLTQAEGGVRIDLEPFSCHQIVELRYG